MIVLSYKTKQLLLVSTKIVVVTLAFYFIYKKLNQNSDLDWSYFATIIIQKKASCIVFILVLLTFLNRFLEILKWQNLVHRFYNITIAQATQQVLTGLTMGIFTPNGIGEYAAKTLFFKKEYAKSIVFLNLVCNAVQLLWVVFWGAIGLLYFNTLYFIITTKTVMVLCVVVLLVLLLFFLGKKINIKGYSLVTVIAKFKEIPKQIHKKNILLAFFRYVVLMHQYYFLFLLFGVTIPYLTLITSIMASYFIASALPTFQFLDFAIKGSVAAYFFGFLAINQWIVVFVTVLILVLNIVIPVLIGSFYVLRLKPKW